MSDMLTTGLMLMVLIIASFLLGRYHEKKLNGKGVEPENWAGRD